MNKQTVFVVDDDASVRKSLCALLASAKLPNRDFASAKAFLAEGISEAGCLIADVRMPEMSGLELQEEIVKRGYLMPVIIVTGHGDVPLAVRAMKAGAVDFVEKPFDDEALLASVHKALESGRQVRNRSQEAEAAHELLSLLTPRERQVLEQLVVSRSNKVAAHELAISPRTIEIHRARIMDKLNARSLSDLVRTAMAASLPPLVSH
jgi:two-component system, LuxR family, response regulator FixJ